MGFLRGAKRFTALLVTGTMLVSSLTGCESEGRAYHAKSNTKGSGDIRAEGFVAIEGGKKVSWPSSDKADDNTLDDNAGGESEKGEEEPVVHVKRADIKPSDYGNKDNWMRLPEEVIKQYDTVYLYPLSCTEDTEEACSIDDASMRERAEWFYLRQAAFYEEFTNVFVPYYRQGKTEGADTSVCDIEASLDRYFEEYNNGRAFVLAGDEYGAGILDVILDEYMASHPGYEERMIAAYLTEYDGSRESSETPAGDTGNITVWRSFEKVDTDTIRDDLALRTGTYYLNNTEHEIKPLAGEPADYSDPENWLAMPYAAKEVDTVWLYPLGYYSAEEGAPAFCDIDDKDMRRRARSNFRINSLAFSGATNVFAPFYRQASAYSLKGMGPDEACDALSGGVSRTDVYAALDYYFENLNGGRPFILAGHSQGSMLIRIILKEYMASHPDIYARMVAAYPIGFSITEKDLNENPHLKFAGSDSDTGVIVSWNTEGPENGESSVVAEGAVAINPLNWKRDDTYASAGRNRGSYIPNRDNVYTMVVPGVSDAKVDPERGVVVSTTEEYEYSDSEKIAGSQIFGEKSFHNYDYLFFFENIRLNVENRVNNYLKNNP